MTSCISVTLSCAALASFYAALAHPELPSPPALLIPCTNGDTQCSHYRSFVFFLGALTGLRFSLNYFLNNGSLVSSGPARPNKLQSVKAKLRVRFVAKACASHGVTFSIIALDLCLYIALGWVISVFGEGTWSEWQVLFNAPLLLAAILAKVLLATTLAFFTHVFQLFITQPLAIPVAVEEDEGADSWCLSHTLSCGGLLQLLSFQDLRHLATPGPFGAHRRQQVFAISNPGGHPRNWLGIMTPSLNLVRKFTDRLRSHNCPEDLPKPPAPPASSSTDINKNEVKAASVPLSEKLKTVLLGLKRYPVFCYFMTELPDATNRSIFAEAASVINSVYGLGDLIAASYTEDKYGVVQRNIPDILTAFIQLQQVVDKVGRGGPNRKIGNIEVAPSDQQLRKALRLALRSTLYTITTTFKDTIKEISVSAECQSKLRSYLEFKEG
ncbi:unnamed protein product [Meganyctiphanes norvegica]|uniref:Nucleoporin NDC1 n=1 Tax=Meganyctiphanes norvegica TaxID=48144 RepID=A0AAV2RD02_MEGNR